MPRHGATAYSTNVRYGAPGDQALIGDWNGDGTTTYGIRRGGIGILRNAMSQDAPVVTALLDGSPTTSLPIVGHWSPMPAAPRTR